MSAAELSATGPDARRARAGDPLSLRLLRSEVALVVGRRRNQMGLLVLAAVPVILAVAVKLSSPRPGEGPDFLSSITANGLFVPLAALTVELPFFLPLAMAMLCGDAVAGEANLGTLRYLLVVPVSRVRLLAVKYASLCIGALLGAGTVAVAGAAIGLALFGAGPLTTLSGTTIGTGAAVGRVVLVTLVVAAHLAALAAVGLFVSTLTEQPIAATVAVTITVLVMWVLDGVPQLDWLHPWLLVHSWPTFADLLRDPPFWDGVLRSLGVDAAYAVVFWLLAWARFAGKDVTS
jgi:ABC-2 type transport system permease protein